MTKLEEIARALCGVDFSERNIDHWDGDWELFIPAARAAVEAMREPTGAMIDAGQPWAIGTAPPNCWVKMIDAMLNERGTAN